MGRCLELLLGVLDTSSLSALASALLLPGPISVLLLGLLLLLEELGRSFIPLNCAELVSPLLVVYPARSLSLGRLPRRSHREKYFL